MNELVPCAWFSSGVYAVLIFVAVILVILMHISIRNYLKGIVRQGEEFLPVHVMSLENSDQFAQTD